MRSGLGGFGSGRFMHAGWIADRVPGRCEICRGWSDSAPQSLCRDCQARFAATVPRCPHCALPLVSTGRDCGHCLHRRMAFSHCVAALDYVPPWDRLIAQMKFHARPELARPLAACLVEAIEHAQGLGDATAPRPDWVLPIPLAPQRLRERGFNQAWELARHVARSLGLSAHAGMLLRWRDTAQQSGLSLAERASNLHQAFVVAPAQVAALRGRNLALVDDVCTSGATADAAAQALLAAGAASVQIWVVARTPPPQD